MFTLSLSGRNAEKNKTRSRAPSAPAQQPTLPGSRGSLPPPTGRLAPPGPRGRPFPVPAPLAARLRPPARVVAAAAAALEELGEDGGPRGSSQTTRRRCPRARRVPRRQRRGLARGKAAWASASLRFLGSGPAASAGAATAEAEAPARLSPPSQPEPGEARRPGWLEGGPLPENGNSLHQDMETVQSPG